jgi:uncharacterized Zn-binding protein involved in type VI secretion
MRWIPYGKILIVFLYVSRPVASLQFDLSGAAQVTLAPEIKDKQLACAPVRQGQRCIIYGLNQTQINGKIATVSGAIPGISGIVGSSPDGIQVPVTVTAIASPSNLAVK